MLFDLEILLSLLTLTAMEIVLGIDNVVFISVLVSRLKEPEATRARQIGLGLALVFRVVMLFGLTWLIGLTAPVVFGLSWRDIILLAGGLFLLYKATHEIHREIEDHGAVSTGQGVHTFGAVVAQIAVIDLVFSIDSIITAIGMAQQLWVMVTAVMIAVAVMYFSSSPVSRFIHEHPTAKMLALSFLMLIGVLLVAESLGFHIPRGYIYFAMAFSCLVEFVNVLVRRARKRKDTPGPDPEPHSEQAKEVEN